MNPHVKNPFVELSIWLGNQPATMFLNQMTILVLKLWHSSSYWEVLVDLSCSTGKSIGWPVIQRYLPIAIDVEVMADFFFFGEYKCLYHVWQIFTGTPLCCLFSTTPVSLFIVLNALGGREGFSDHHCNPSSHINISRPVTHMHGV